MESHGIFGKDAPFRDQRGGRNVTFGEHDDRGSGGGRRGRRGGWRGRGRGGRGRWRGRGGGNTWTKVEEVDEEGDAMMDDESRNQMRPQSYGGRHKSEGGRGSVFSRLGSAAGGSSASVFSRLSGIGGERRGSSWHKVTIPRGNKQNREWLLRQLKASIHEQFQPVQVHVKGDMVLFFVEESRAANQLKKLGELECRDGSLPILVKPCPPPRGAGEDGDQRPQRFNRSGRGGGSTIRGGGSAIRTGVIGSGRLDGDVQMEEDNTAVILQVLGVRFDTSTRSLDLSDMFHDQILREHGIKGMMQDRNFVTIILSLIGQHCPDLLALDLSSNRLQHLDVYAELPTKCASLQILNLSDNQLRSAAELENIHNMEALTTLVLENNPFSQHNQDFVSYASRLRRLFPNLQLLDGQQLPSPVKFDLPVSAGQLPPVEKSYLVNDEVKGLVVTFLEQFYSMYDGDSREKLLEAYSNDAVFSLSAISARGPPLHDYISQSRNLCRLKDPSKKISLLKHGRIDIVQCLRDLPKTRHHPGAFSVDVIRATPVYTAFVVYGLFSEVTGLKPENYYVRAFTRTFMLTAAGNGVAIINDQMTIWNANSKSVQYAREETSKLQAAQQQPKLPHAGIMDQPSTSAVPGPSFHSSTPVFTAQEEIVRKLSAETSMNLEWSRKCLSENEWDYNKAYVAFSLLQKQGKVPPQAFQ